MTTPPPPASVPAPAPRTTPTGRLGQGELRRQVAGCLAADPAAEFTPGSVARTLGKSAGATGNALATPPAGARPSGCPAARSATAPRRTPLLPPPPRPPPPPAPASPPPRPPRPRPGRPPRRLQGR